MSGGIFVLRFFLTAVGLLYLWLSVWCILQPASTSRLVGFELLPGSGESEFLVVYGGLELGLSLVFLWPLLQPSAARTTLIYCTLIHGCLAGFRGVSFFLFSGIELMTRKLAAGEWLIFVTGVILLLTMRAREARGGSSGAVET